MKGDVNISINDVPNWMLHLEDEDLTFIRNFMIASGSLKDVANYYGVSYPTVRLRLDKTIQKIKVSEEVANDPYIALIKSLVVNEKIDFDTAKVLISNYKKQTGGKL